MSTDTQSATSYGADLYTDFGGLAKLRAGAARNSQDSKRAVAEQVEALFVGMMLKSMRAGAGGGAFGATGAGMHRDLYDSQLAQHIARGGKLGFADMMLREFGATDPPVGGAAAPRPDAGYPAPSRNLLLARGLWMRSPASEAPEQVRGLKEVAKAADNPGGSPSTWPSPEAFVADLWPAAERAAREIGTSPQAVLAVAALETGWGRHLPSRPDGGPSYNLFGIKAHGWDGNVTRATTLEFEGGTFTARVEPFRSYGSPEEAFADFAAFVKSQPRYRQALASASQPEAFLRGLHAAGYATDPAYGDKLVKIMNSAPLRTTTALDSRSAGLPTG